MQKPSERLKRKVEKENLWLFILTLLIENDKLTGSEIKKLLLEKFNLKIGTVTSYKVLYLLKRGGYVKQECQSNRKVYSITESGVEELIKGKEILEDYINMLPKHIRYKK